MQRWMMGLAAVFLMGGTAALVGGQGFRRGLVTIFDATYEPPEGDWIPVFDGPDADRDPLRVDLVPVAEGFDRITDLQFVPGASDLLVVLQQGGQAWWTDLATGERGLLFEIEVTGASEQGLLGLAFHPDFEENGRFYVNATPSGVRPEVSRVSAWEVAEGGLRAGEARAVATVLEVEQPYQNHNAGQLAFGPDGYLYIGWGDGGFRNDPEGHGQDATTLLGSMLRIDVDGPPPYAIPADNPFVDDPEIPDETWAIGLRNPWRYSFAPDGRLIVADVGQDAWEEVSLAEAGDNLGWAVREGSHCFPPDADCPTEGFVDPIHDYTRHEGISITGGYVYTGEAVPALAGLYVFGDFGSGRLWAIPLAPDPPVLALGRWPMLVSTFGRDAAGEIYVAAYGQGTVHRITPHTP